MKRETSSFLLAAFCVAASLSCTAALDPNIGTGKNCAAVSDGAGGPKCQGSQIGLCCTASESSNNCLTLLGDGSDPAATFATLNQVKQENNPSAPTCAEVMYGGQSLSPFCCDEMDLPNCPTAAVESMGAPPEQISGGQGCVDDIVQFCCANAGPGGMGGKHQVDHPRDLHGQTASA
ncbi:hypothetical protein WJX77_002136 [Trebouxia sp. C0004]